MIFYCHFSRGKQNNSLSRPRVGDLIGPFLSGKKRGHFEVSKITIILYMYWAWPKLDQLDTYLGLWEILAEEEAWLILFVTEHLFRSLRNYFTTFMECFGSITHFYDFLTGKWKFCGEFVDRFALTLFRWHCSPCSPTCICLWKTLSKK